MALAAELKGRLNAGELVLGTWIIGSRSPSFVRLIASIGYDYLLLDTQHAPLNDETLADMCDVAAAAGIAAIVRLRATSAPAVNHVLDLGAAGVMCPDCRDANVIQEALRGIRFPPDGTRSAMGISPTLDFRTPTTPADLTSIESSSLLAAQIESEDGARNATTIAIPGVDILDIGRGDLAVDLHRHGGFPGTYADDIIQIVIDTAKNAGISVGTTCATVEEGQAFIKRGMNFITYASDRRLLAESYSNGLRELRDSGRSKA